MTTVSDTPSIAEAPPKEKYTGLQISPSQDETWDRCHRQWWFDSVLRLPQPPKAATTVGLAAHAAIERWMGADDTGRDLKTGLPVDIYPEGWHIVKERGQADRTLTLAEQAQVKKLIAAAIETGKMVRDPTRRIERQFVREVIPGVRIKGKIDIDIDGQVQDHKFLKTLRYAASSSPKSPHYVAKKLQMLDYASIKVLESIDEGKPLERVLVRHNSFCKDPAKPEVKIAEAWVTHADALSNWSRLQKQAASMKAIADKEIAEEDWRMVKGPCQPDACSAFGGCQRAQICNSFETVSQHRERVTRETAAAISQQSQRQQMTDVDIFANLKKAKAPVQPAPTQTSTPAQAAAKAAPVVQAAPAAQGAPAAPWANPTCKACSTGPHPGFNTAGDPCRMCDLAATKSGKASSLEYTIWVDEAGKKRWAKADGTDAGEAPAGEPVKVTQAQVAPPAAVPDQTAAQWEALMGGTQAQVVSAPARSSAPAVTSTAAAVAAPAEDEDDGSDAAPAPAGTKAKKGAGRPRAGFRMFIGAVSLKTTMVTAEALFAERCAMAATEGGVGSFFDLDPFKRRDLWHRAAPKLVEGLNRMDILCPARPDPDLGAFIAALKPLATEVIVAVSA